MNDLPKGSMSHRAAEALASDPLLTLGSCLRLSFSLEAPQPTGLSASIYPFSRLPDIFVHLVRAQRYRLLGHEVEGLELRVPVEEITFYQLSGDKAYGLVPLFCSWWRSTSDSLLTLLVMWSRC